MPEWNPRANDIFVRAAEIDLPDDRRLFVERQCNGDAALRAQVESLLAARGQIGSFLQRPAVAAPGSCETAAYPLTEGPGSRVGPYKLLQHIGEGGMGVVYMAEQDEPVRRKVALKIIKPGMDSKQVVARFEAERQALSMMDHPNIARVLDAGTTDSGRPFFVMELVHGVPITEFCDANKLTPRERLALFVPVCQAIQHAHQKGVIHRDVKPSNVLVTMYDDRPVPKVIDFGVAKAVEQRLTEKTLFTQFGSLVGTFEYMSPEQAEMNAFGVDTRSDVYSLGVLLYELLTGTTPLERRRLRPATPMDFDSGTMLELIGRLRAGDGAAYGELVRRAGGRVELLARRMLAGYPDVARWEQAEDVLQNAHRRLWKALRTVTPRSTRSFFNFAAHLIQRELIDLARRHRGPEGVAANHESDVQAGPRSRLNVATPADPDLEAWAACHEAVARLPEKLREVFALTLYAGLPRSEIATCLGVSERTVQRRLAAAVGRLQATLGDRWVLTADRAAGERDGLG
jgi:RNA polymerase sigma factor (sigma-70 family)